MPEPTQLRRPRADAERNRTRLLDAAKAAFASGHGPVTLDQIARDAEVGIGTLYRHFPTRDVLIEALYRQELARLSGSADELLRTYPPERALYAWMDLFAEFVLARRELVDALRAAFASGAVSVSQSRQELTVAVRTILDAGIAAGTLRDDVRPEDVVAMVVGALNSTSVVGGREQLARMFDLFIDAVTRPETRTKRLEN